MFQQTTRQTSSFETLGPSKRWHAPLVATACITAILIGWATLSCQPAESIISLGAQLRATYSKQQLLQSDKDVLLSLKKACEQLDGRHRQLCEAFLAAEGEDKWTAAAAWRQGSPGSYACSGIEAHCLQQDMQLSNSNLDTASSSSTTTSRSSCKPLPTGTRCSPGLRCNRSYCRGRSHAATQDTNTGNTPKHGSKQQDLNDEMATRLQSQLQYMQQERDIDATHRILAELSTQATTQTGSRAPQPLLPQQLPQYTAPVPYWPTIIFSVDVSNVSGARVPETFLATSHEYTRIADYGSNAETAAAWANVFGMLSASPVIRVGGASQDKMMQIPGDQEWQALKRLRTATNGRFLFGLPLWQQNATAMSKQIMALAQKHLGGAVTGFELGNEPEFWPTGLGGYTASGQWVAGFTAYADYFNRVARQLNPCGTGSGRKQLSGPGWGNVNTQPAAWWVKVLWAGKDCYLAEANTHYYPYINNETVSPSELLSQGLQDFGLEKFVEYQRLAAKAGLRVRISETNSLYGGGRQGLSDTFAAALWVADALFEFASAGAAAFHLHWGVGGHPTHHLGSPNTGVQTNYYYVINGTKWTDTMLEPLGIKLSSLSNPIPYPSIHAPWYGYLFWTMAANGDYKKTADTTFLPVTAGSQGNCNANIKVHALKATNGDIRIAILNKDARASCNVQLQLPSSSSSSSNKTLLQNAYCKQATLGRLLPGPEGLLSKAGIRFQGQSYENAGFEGKIQGQRQVQLVKARRLNSATCVFEVGVQAASGALLIVKQ